MSMKNKLGSLASIAGVILLIAGTMLHPMQADPNDALAAFTEYAGDRHWIGSHLMQFFGVAGIVLGLILFANKLDRKGDSGLVKIAVAGAVISAALAAVLQAVDGIALKAMVDAWANAAPADKQSLFHATLAVRSIEIGVASLFCLVIGLTAVLFSAAIYTEERYPRWVAFLGALGGVATAVAGIVIAYTGFSALSMRINMPANMLLLAWICILAAWHWKESELT
jgi:hypothetical protein